MRNKRAFRKIFLFCILGIGVFSLRVGARLMPPPYMVDVREMAEKAPIVFRGRVVSVKSRGEPGGRPLSAAIFEPDRVYRGAAAAEESLDFLYAQGVLDGHDCIDFQPDTYWLVFAVNRGGHLDMIDDCIGALAVAQRMGRKLVDDNWVEQMEEDFKAGLDDSKEAERILSLQRLGGLGLPSSRGVLHEVIGTGRKDEATWAVYAALRTGDVSVLPQARELLAAATDAERPESAIALELKNVSDAQAVPDLLAILRTSRVELARACVMSALAENTKDRRAVPAFAESLDDRDLHVRWMALVGMENLSGSQACAVPREGSNDESAMKRQIGECLSWWEHEGKFENWDAR